mmetsp:Transcript_36283/g.80753  ORF Transcript_36283/g.80753 Transcript_36283/m.80753 type:complete len:471 (-) Transcript_36283:1012-2424(-)|eukprot:CAMPEP_0202900276 /NCGR_PEP_ID=MMETSP1392-20130828/10788_1 /ASSEMBLY_ACC=CAM_ASM_000868 /TAXON_ID=225041 /ORGANISM="Chlamydomonas chlamydogama, Strain SAG 11-48b" /LENGTH=470 /DNA_ID=CAMNT_0049586631 /DNA_START=156 /DNA_END=1568 /DNA_ORIENTATION=-
MLLSAKLRSAQATRSSCGRRCVAAVRPAVSRRVTRVFASGQKGVLVKAKDHVAVGGEENPGSPEVSARIDSGGRLPGGKKKTAIITGASSGLGLHTAKVLVKTGDWNVICAVRDRAKMERMAKALEFPPGSYTIKEVDLRSLSSVRKFCAELTKPALLGGAPGFDCVLGNAAVYYPMLKDPKKFRLGFHMAGAGALAVNRMGSEAIVTEDGFEESVGVIHLAHFLMFNLLLDSVEKYGRETKTKPRMIIVGSITHNPTELAGKIPPQANLGNCEGLFAGFKVEDGIAMIDNGPFDGPKAYKDAKACNMLTIFEMHRRFHESKNIVFNTMYPGCIAETPLFRNHYPAFQKLFPAFQKYITGGYVSVEEAGERLASVCCDPEYEKSGCYWSWKGGIRGANGATAEFNKTEKGLGGKFENRVSQEVADIELAKLVWDASAQVVGLKSDGSDPAAPPPPKSGFSFNLPKILQRA